MNLNRHEAQGVALRLAVWLPLLLWLGWHWGRDYAALFLPLYRDVLELALNGFDFADIEIIRSHEYLFKATYTIERSLVLGPRVTPAGLDGYVQAPIYYAVTHPIVLAAAALVWPGLCWRGRLLRLLVSLPVLIGLEALDMPLVIYSAINEAVMQTYDPQGFLASPPIDWIRILEGGGRTALCLAAAFVAARMQAMLQAMVQKHRTSPA